MKILITLLALMATTLFGGKYTVDTDHSSVAFKVRHLMISNVRGNFTKFEGEFVFDEKKKTLDSLKGTIEVASIDTGIEDRDKHLTSAEIFNAAKYPTITFELTKVDGDEAYGKLTMHGVTKDVILDYEYGGTIVDNWETKKVGISLSGKINRRDFGVTWNKILESGGVAVSEKVRLEIDLQGALEEDDE